MSSSDSRWTELASQNERVVQLGESGCGSTDKGARTALSEWAELASQSERLVDDNDPLFRLASSSHRSPGRGGSPGLRLVAGAA